MTLSGFTTPIIVGLTEVGQNIVIGSEFKWWWFRTTDASTDVAWVGNAGRWWRAYWFFNGDSYQDLGSIPVGFLNVTAPTGLSPGFVLTGTFLIHATFTATFPAQSGVREVYITFGVGGGGMLYPISEGGGITRFDMTTDDNPYVGPMTVTFSRTMLFTAGSGVTPVILYFSEDDANEDRDSSTLSTDQQMEVFAVQLAG